MRKSSRSKEAGEEEGTLKLQAEEGHRSDHLNGLVLVSGPEGRGEAGGLGPSLQVPSPCSRER